MSFIVLLDQKIVGEWLKSYDEAKEYILNHARENQPRIPYRYGIYEDTNLFYIHRDPSMWTEDTPKSNKVVSIPIYKYISTIKTTTDSQVKIEEYDRSS